MAEDNTLARYGQAFKEKAVAPLLPAESADLEVVAREMGVSAGTLDNWPADALASRRKSGYLDVGGLFAS